MSAAAAGWEVPAPLATGLASASGQSATRARPWPPATGTSARGSAEGSFTKQFERLRVRSIDGVAKPVAMIHLNQTKRSDSRGIKQPLPAITPPSRNAPSRTILTEGIGKRQCARSLADSLPRGGDFAIVRADFFGFCWILWKVNGIRKRARVYIREQYAWRERSEG